MKIIFLGTGTSQGIPVIGCTCATCQSSDPHDQRLRVSVHVQLPGGNLNIDVGPDFRQQMLRAQVNQLDAILITHEHNDHIIGLDDVRSFLFLSGQPMDVYCDQRVAQELRQRFAYAFADNPYPGAPQLNLHLTNEQNTLDLLGERIQIVSYLHGRLPIQGYRIGNFAYLTDLKSISEEALQQLQGLDVLVLGALHRREHHSHLNLYQALDLIQTIAPRQAYLTHLSHHMGPAAQVSAELPANVALAYDGLTLTL